MSALSDAIQELRDLLVVWKLEPPTTYEVRIAEISAHWPERVGGKLLIRRGGLLEPSQYEERFEQLVRSGLSWINVHCVGVHEGRLIVVVEVPDRIVGAPRASVNYSGPGSGVVENGWNAETAAVFA